MEVNHRKIQAASLFATIQQVETEIHKEQQTTEQHNCDKALANLRKARFMKQMQNLTKKLKEQTILTHSYPMPKPTNATELTKRLPDDFPDEVPIPDIEKDLQEELTKLGLNTTSLTNSNSGTNKRMLEKTPECKLSVSSSSSSAEPENTTTISTENPTCGHKNVEQCEPTHECEDTKQPPSQASSQPQEIQKSQVSQLSNKQGNKNEDTEKVIHVHVKQPQTKNSDEFLSSEDFSDRSTSTAIKPLKLSYNNHKEAYPWAHEASKNFSKTTPLAQEEEEVEFLNMTYRSLPKYITTAQKEKMRQSINLTGAAMRKIEENIGIKKEDTGKIFFCKVCDPRKPYQSQRKPICKRHVRMHLGYSFYRCSFCNFISNNLTSVTIHYITRHGIPKKWILSTEI